MTRKQKFFTLLVLLAFLLSLLLLPLPSRSEETDKQVVLLVVSNGTEEKLVVPQAVVILRLAPISGETSKAPLSNGDRMVCHPYGYKDANQIDHAGFRCGSDIYAIVGIRYKP